MVTRTCPNFEEHCDSLPRPKFEHCWFSMGLIFTPFKCEVAVEGTGRGARILTHVSRKKWQSWGYGRVMYQKRVGDTWGEL
eukprot:scaffold64168_cov78-Attheya_sp.AAC.7